MYTLSRANENENQLLLRSSYGYFCDKAPTISVLLPTNDWSFYIDGNGNDNTTY